MYVSCPVTRDDVLNTDGIYQFCVTGTSTGSTFRCTLRSYTKFGTLVQAQDLQGGSGQIELCFDITSSSAHGYYNLLCNLPPNSLLYGYRLYERETGYDDMTDYNQ